MRSLLIVVLLGLSTLAQAGFVDKLINDMGKNDAKLMNAPNTDWSKHGYLDMGFAARGDATPSYWAKKQGARFTSSSPWRAILPWFQIWPVEGNSEESRVQVSDIKVQLLINDEWQLLNLPTGQWSQLEPWTLIGGKKGVDQREEREGVYSYLVTNSGPIHGGLGKFDLWSLGVNPSQIEGVAISAIAEIIEGEGNVLFEIGGDYYPNTNVSVERDFKLGWGPAIGGSKFTRIEGKTCVYMTTISPPGVGDTSKFERNGGKVALTHAELRANPPRNFCPEEVEPAPVPVPVEEVIPLPGKKVIVERANELILRLQELVQFVEEHYQD